MADQEVKFRLRATNDASAELIRVAADMRRLNAEAVNSQRGVASWGSSWGTASASITAGAKSAAGGLDALNQAAKGVASGGFQQMLSTIPGVGGALANLANQLGPSTLLLGGFAAAGVGVLKFLQGLSQESDAALAKVTALAEGIGAATRQASLEVQKIRADAAGDKTGALEAANAKELAAIEDAKNKRIAAAKAELDALDLFGRKRTERSQAGRNEILAAEADAALKTFVINEKKKADLKTLDDERLANEKKNRDEAVKNEADAAQKAAEIAKKYIEDVAAGTAKAGEIFKGLGKGFEDMAGKLSLAAYLQKARADIETLKGYQELIAGGDETLRQAGITAQGVGAAIAQLTTNMQDAARTGAVPLAEGATAVAKSLDTAAAAASRAAPSFAELADAMREAAAAQAALANRPKTGGGDTPSIRGSGAIGNPNEAANVGAALSNFADESARYQASQVLGSAQDALSRYGRSGTNWYNYPESATAAAASSARGTGGMGSAPAMSVYRDSSGALTNVRPQTPGGNTTVNNFNISQSGTVITQERDWQSLVSSIGDSLSARGQ